MSHPLPLLTPNARRGQRTIARCHERLARGNATYLNTAYLMVERALIGGLCLIYISGVARVAMQVLGGG